MSATDDLNAVANDLDTLKTAIQQVSSDLNVPAVTSVGDQVLEALTAAGFTVTAPAPVEPAPEVPPTEG